MLSCTPQYKSILFAVRTILSTVGETSGGLYVSLVKILVDIYDYISRDSIRDKVNKMATTGLLISLSS